MSTLDLISGLRQLRDRLHYRDPLRRDEASAARDLLQSTAAELMLAAARDGPRSRQEAAEPVDEVIVTPGDLQELLVAAYETGAHDVHDHWLPDRDPSFKEAAGNYVASLDFTGTTRPYRPAAELTRLQEEVKGLRWVADLYDGEPTSQDIGNELADYAMILDNVGKVYDHVTGGRVSKANTAASAVIAVSDDHVTSLVEEEVAERLQAAKEEASQGAGEPVASQSAGAALASAMWGVTLTPASPPNPQARTEALEAWEWLAGQTNLSLDFQYDDPEDEGVWAVCGVTGPVNDREWERVAFARTPLDAVLLARTALQAEEKA